MNVGPEPGAEHAFRWHRTVALIGSIVFLFYVVQCVWTSIHHPSEIDFLSFWAAAKLAVSGEPALAYDIAAHRAMEQSAGPFQGLNHFPYPPPFLLMLVPFGLLSFPLSVAAWLLCTGGLYLFSVRRITVMTYAMAQPAAIANPVSGQNGLLTAGLFLLGLMALQRRPFLAGLILGLLVIKPQLAMLIPVALLAGRQWWAIGGAALSAIALSSAALLLFGIEAYRGFLAMLPFHADLLSQSTWAWFQLASPFAGLRSVGVPQAPALLVHALVAVGAAAVTWRAWAAAHPCRIEILAAASVLGSPYLFIYDTLPMVAPVAALLRQKRPYTSAAVWGLCAVPMLGYLGLYPGPNTTPLAAVVAVYALYGRHGTHRGRSETDIP